MFGIGEGQGDVRAFKKECEPMLEGNEILIAAALCKEERKPVEESIPPLMETLTPDPYPLPPTQVTAEPKTSYTTTDTPQPTGKNRVRLGFNIPRGKVSQIMGTFNLLQQKFNDLRIEIHAYNGRISDQEYEDKIKEAFIQMGIEVEEL